MVAFISSVFGASINAKPLDSCVSGLRITLIASATRFSAVSHPLISSAVTQVGKLPRNTVKLIQRLFVSPSEGVCFPEVFQDGIYMLPHWIKPVNGATGHLLTLRLANTASAAARRHAPMTAKADVRPPIESPIPARKNRWIG